MRLIKKYPMKVVGTYHWTSSLRNMFLNRGTNIKKTFLLFLLFLLLFHSQIQAQNCNCVESTTDLTVTSGQTVVLNAYYPGNASALAGSTDITIGAKRTFTGATDLGGTISAGDVLLIVQMQGVELNVTIPEVTNPATDVLVPTDYGDGPDGLTNQGSLDNGDFIAGQFEFVMATNDVSAAGGTLTISNGLGNSYIAEETPTATIGRRTYQIIKVGNYNDLTIQGGAEVTTIPWNGNTGGIISIDVLGTLDLDGTIDADFAGFRGGFLNPAVSNGDPNLGFRGEGIAGSSTQLYGYNDDFSAISGTTGLTQGYPGTTVNNVGLAVTIDPPGFVSGLTFDFTPDRGIGGPGNAGGTGILNNGGAGGGNGASGGLGANTFRIQSSGGAGFDLQQGRFLFLGGGGGSGGQSDVNNAAFSQTVSSGRPGGGAVIIRVDTLTGTGGVININGDDGGTNVVDVDGAGGGGGAGGSIILVTSSEDISGITINAAGGDGSNLDGAQQSLTPDGGGAGGGGGNVLLVRRGGTFSSPPTIDTNGGALGRTQGTPDDDSNGGTGSVSFLTTPPTANLDCPLITLPAPTPGGVEGSIIWFNPIENVSFNGSNQINSWNDFSSSNFTLTNTGVTGITGTTPDYIEGSFIDPAASSNPNFNFNPSVSFNEGVDNDDYLAFENFSNISTNAITTFAVVHFPAGTPNNQTVFSYLPNDDQDDEFDLSISNDSGNDGIQQRILDNSAGVDGDLRDGITRIIAVDYNTTDANIFLNNGNPVTTGITGALDQSGIFVLGQDIDEFATPVFDATRELQGQIGDVIYFDNVLSSTDRQQVSSFLAIKYGITLDQGTPQDYLNSIGESIYPSFSEDADYADFRNDIAGIGRDDASGLNQLRSMSINSTAILTGSQTDGLSTDRQFLVWGRNDGALTFNTTEISTGIIERLQREWRVATTNNPGPVDLSFDVSGATNIPAITENVALVVDDDGDFSNGFLRTISATGFDGSTLTFEGVTLNDDEVITIATVPDSPGGAAGLVLWLRANDGVTTSGTEVTTWVDQSGSGTDFTSRVFAGADGGEIGPTLVTGDANFNGNESFDFTDNYLAVDNYPNFPSGTDFSFITVQRADNTATQGGAALIGYGEEEFDIRNLDAVAFEVDNGNINFGTDYRNQTAIASFLWDEGNGAADAATFFFNGTSNANNPIAITEPNIGVNLDFFIGQEGDNDGTTDANENYIGQLGEVIMFNSQLSAVERDRVESYLAIKYGITLDNGLTDYVASDGDFIYETVVVPADYNNDIAGIGRDDISSQDQRRSISNNADAIVTMALTDNGGTFAAPNAFGSNLSFLAWGNDNDDNGTIEDINTDVPSNVITRLDRQWRVQEKGIVGNVTLQIDISGVDPFGADVDFIGRSADDFLLMIDDGGDFDNGLTRSFEVTSFDAGNEIVTFEVNFNDGDIFTLATSRAANGPGGVTSDLITWLRADIGTSTTTDNTTLATWTDQGGAGNSATDDGNPPLFRDNATDNINGNPIVSFDGADDRLAVNLSGLIGSNYSLFGVGERQSNANQQNVIGFDITNGSGTNEVLEFGYGSNITATLAQSGNDLDATVSAFDDPSVEPFLLFGEFFGTGHSIQENRNSATVTNTNANADALAGTNNGFVGFGETGFFNGNIAETVVYTTDLTADEETRINSYLALKYGITLNMGDFEYTSSNGTVYFPGNTNMNFSGFRNDVAGIGRDDLSEFEQLTSMSENNTAALSVTKNDPFDIDGQYFVWAHNGTEVTGAAGPDVPSGIESRLGRIWRLKTTNTPSGTASFTFNLTGVTIDAASDLALLIDSDGDFSDATVIEPTVSQNGNLFTFSGVDLSNFSDEDVFTIGSIDNSDTPLPLDFLGFNVRVDDENNIVSLAWQTTNEVDVSHFEIERSSDGSNFSVIGTLGANNIENAINEYAFTDRSPLNAINYYRIKQVDFDGQFDFSELRFGIVNNQIWEVNVYPNPASVELNIGTNFETNGRLKVIDVNGRVIMDYPTQGGIINKLDISLLPLGTYIFQFESILGVRQERFIKQ